MLIGLGARRGPDHRPPSITSVLAGRHRPARAGNGAPTAASVIEIAFRWVFGLLGGAVWPRSLPCRPTACHGSAFRWPFGCLCSDLPGASWGGGTGSGLKGACPG